MSINLKSLIGKLNEPTRKTLESAAGLCLARTNYDIEVEHYVLKLLDQPYGDFSQIVNRFNIDASRLNAELTRSLDKLKKGNARTPALSPHWSKCSPRRGPSAHWTLVPRRFEPGLRCWLW